MDSEQGSATGIPILGGVAGMLIGGVTDPNGDIRYWAASVGLLGCPYLGCGVVGLHDGHVVYIERDMSTEVSQINSDLAISILCGGACAIRLEHDAVIPAGAQWRKCNLRGIQLKAAWHPERREWYVWTPPPAETSTQNAGQR